MVSLRPTEGFVGEVRKAFKKNFKKNREKPKGRKRHNLKFTRGSALVLFLILLIGTLNILFILPQNGSSERSVNIRGTATHVVINEVYYDPKGSGLDPKCEWIELYNPTSSEVDISGWKLADGYLSNNSYEGIWTFPSDTKIPAGGYILVVNDATYKNGFSSLFPGVTPDFDTNTSNSVADLVVKGTLTLSNSGDDLHLYDSSDNEVDAM